jgi:phosphatidylglycerophosphate synthase
MKLLTFPNLLSLSRLPLAAAFLIVDTVTGRAAILTIVALTDLADGYFARRMPSHDRKTGQIIDPITDKLFVLIALLAFAVRRDISIGELLILLARDIFNTVGFFILKALDWQIEFKARLSGKTTTVLQLAVLMALLFWPAGVRPLVIVVGLASVIAIADYSRVAFRRQRLARPETGR